MNFLQKFQKTNLLSVIIWLMYFFINGLFLVKYMSDLFSIRISFFIFLVYAVFILSAIFFIIKINFSDFFFKTIFWVVVSVFFIFTIVLNNFVDADSLKVDRWSAMENGVKAIINWEYPYNIPDHLNNKSSNLPTLILLGIPFYWAFGSVGYLQSFVFLLFAYIIFRLTRNFRYRLVSMVVLIFSPAYLWEIYVKSDLFSNFMICSLFVIIVWKNIENATTKIIFWTAFFAALLLLTRIPVVIPMLMLLSKPFLNFSTKKKTAFMAVFIFTALALLSVFFFPAKDLKMIQEHNPFLLQSRYPFAISFLFFVSAIFISFKIKKLSHIFQWSAILLFISVFIMFIYTIMLFGLEKVFLNSYFDISHFNMAMVFVILSIAKKLTLKGQTSREIT